MCHALYTYIIICSSKYQMKILSKPYEHKTVVGGTIHREVTFKN